MPITCMWASNENKMLMSSGKAHPTWVSYRAMLCLTLTIFFSPINDFKAYNAVDSLDKDSHLNKIN